MARAQVTILKTANPPGWVWTFDRNDLLNDSVDNFATAVSPSAALDAVKPLIGQMPGTLSKLVLTVDSFEPPAP